MEANDLLKLKKMYLIKKNEAIELKEYSYYTSYTEEVVTVTFYGEYLKPHENVYWKYHLIQEKAKTLNLGYTIYEVYEKNENEIINPFPLEINFLIPKHINFSTSSSIPYFSYNDGLDGFCEDHIENGPNEYTLRCFVKLRQIEAEKKRGILRENFESAKDYIQSEKNNFFFNKEKNEIVNKIINSSKIHSKDGYQPKYVIQIIYKNGAVGIQNFEYTYIKRSKYTFDTYTFNYEYDPYVSNVFPDNRIIGYVLNKVYVKNEEPFSSLGDTYIMNIPFYISYHQNNFEFINAGFEYRVKLEESKSIFYDTYEEAIPFLNRLLAKEKSRSGKEEIFMISQNAQKIIDSILEYQKFVEETELIRGKVLTKSI